MTLLRRQHPVRALLLKGNYFVGSVVSATLTKLALRMAAVHGATSQTAKSVMADAVLVMSAILELGQSPVATSQIDQVRCRPPPLPPTPALACPGSCSNSSRGIPWLCERPQDSFERIAGCMRTLGEPAVNTTMRSIVLSGCRQAYSELAALQRKNKADREGKKEQEVTAQVDQLITVRQLRTRTGNELVSLGLDDEADIIKGGCTSSLGTPLLRRSLSHFDPPCVCVRVCVASQPPVS